MSETKIEVKIPVGWLRLDRGVTKLPGDWYWNREEGRWRIVRHPRPVYGNNIVIRRCQYKVGETVYVWKSSGFDPELDLGTAVIARVFASDHRGVQQVALKKTGNPQIDSILTACASDILAPVFPIMSGLGSVPQEWDESAIAPFGNDPNEAMQTETVVEALKQAELTEEPQAVQLEPDSVVKETLIAEPDTIICDHQVCELAEPTGVFCPPDSCDIDDGVREMPQCDHIAAPSTVGAVEAVATCKESLPVAEASQPEPWVPLVGDWVVRTGGVVCRVEAVVELFDGMKFYVCDDTTTKFAKDCLQPYSPRGGDQVIVLKKDSFLQGQSAIVRHVTTSGHFAFVQSLCGTKRGRFKVNELLVELPASRHIAENNRDHIADADKMVGNSSETPNSSADDSPQPAGQLTIQPPLPKPKSLYIAGPMRGIAYFNYPMFDLIAGVLRDQGLHVISPADEDRKQDGFDPFENPEYANPDRCVFPSELDFHKTVRRCLDAVMQCEEIVLLPGWERSSGAVAELTLAMWLGKRVRHVRIDTDNHVSFVCFWKGLESLANDLCDEYMKETDEPGDLVGIDDDEEADDILEEALNITRGSRNASYGPPDQDFRRTAGMWSALFAAKLREGETFEPRDVALAMILLKTSRETHQRKRDNWVDIAGYARCGSLCN